MFFISAHAMMIHGAPAPRFSAEWVKIQSQITGGQNRPPRRSLMLMMMIFCEMMLLMESRADAIEYLSCQKMIYLSGRQMAIGEASCAPAPRLFQRCHYRELMTAALMRAAY